MKLTIRIQHAITYAALAHGNQERYASGVPYITHPMGVAMILSDFNVSENVIIAALLHDVLEDTPYLPESIEEEFGEEVLKLVEALTEEKNLDKSWMQIKKEALTKIIKAGEMVMLIKSADALYNMMDTLIYINGTIPMPTKKPNKFKRTGESRLERYRLLICDLQIAWKDNPLIPQLWEVYRKVEEYWE